MATSRKSGVGVWFKEEIENIIASVESANASVAQHVQTPEMRLYCAGYNAALEAIAIAFGVKHDSQSS